MNRTFWLILMIYLVKCASGCCDEAERVLNKVSDESLNISVESSNAVSGSTQSWQGSLMVYPTMATWSVKTSIPLSSNERAISLDDTFGEARRKKGGMRKKMKKYMMPLLIAYKLKFFALIPVMIGGLILLTGATGLAGFFFALFAAVMGLKMGHH